MGLAQEATCRLVELHVQGFVRSQDRPHLLVDDSVTRDPAPLSRELFTTLTAGTAKPGAPDVEKRQRQGSGRLGVARGCFG